MPRAGGLPRAALSLTAQFPPRAAPCWILRLISFAERGSSELLRYLANAQQRGLEGLWARLCAGELPARCTKQVSSAVRMRVRATQVRSSSMPGCR